MSLSFLSVPGKNITRKRATVSNLCQFYVTRKRKYFNAFVVLSAVCQTLRTNLLLCSLYRVATCSVSRTVFINIQ